MDAKAMVEKIRNKKEFDEEWFDIRDEILQFLKEDQLEEEKKLFIPFGYLEVVTMMCDGIERNQIYRKGFSATAANKYIKKAENSMY